MRSAFAAACAALALAAPTCYVVKKSSGNVRVLLLDSAVFVARALRSARAHGVHAPSPTRRRRRRRPPLPQALCFDHSTDADGVLHVNVSCGLDATSGAPGYCAVGFHQAGDASTKMAPAEVFFVTKIDGKAVIEDRFDAAGHAEPLCVQQVSYGVTSDIAADGSFWVAFSRNLNATASGTNGTVYPLTPGSSHNLIAAWGSGTAPTPGSCATGYPEHQ
jgi:hypothetical protein